MRHLAKKIIELARKSFLTCDETLRSLRKRKEQIRKRLSLSAISKEVSINIYFLKIESPSKKLDEICSFYRLTLPLPTNIYIYIIYNEKDLCYYHGAQR